jgi:hypothetical protein
MYVGLLVLQAFVLKKFYIKRNSNFKQGPRDFDMGWKDDLVASGEKG